MPDANERVCILNVPSKLLKQTGPMRKLSFKCTEDDPKADHTKMSYVMIQSGWVNSSKYLAYKGLVNLSIPKYKDKARTVPNMLVLSYPCKDGTLSSRKISPRELKTAFDKTRKSVSGKEREAPFDMNECLESIFGDDFGAIPDGNDDSIDF